MAEAAPTTAIRVEIEKTSRGSSDGPNAPMQVVGGGAVILTGSQALNVECPINANIELNDQQVVGLLQYLGLLNAGIDTSAIETALTTLVAAS